jgi:NifB/MoaA-like Fe-S oxidoreductase
MLAEAGLTLHTQIVLVPGYNDGYILQGTVRSSLLISSPVRVDGVVPVGINQVPERTIRISRRLNVPSLAGKILAEGQRWQKKL